ncbi:MAG: hypothetical protein O2975_09230 [Proteobacteria bacterium]|nr:hypothetical protein [Pseudomonadota bacterium]
MTTRRTWLRAAVAMQGAALLAPLRLALAQGAIEQGIRRIRGEVRVNGELARIGTPVRGGDVVTTGGDGEAIFVWSRDAALVRSGARVEVGGSGFVSLMRVITGAVLTVFSSGRRRRIQTSTATIGIRGTGVYVEVEPARTYVCTCYGVAELVAADDPTARETVRTKHHDEPRYVMAHGAPQMIMGAPIINHSDVELTLLESLVGRRPPFVDQPGYRPRSY